MSTRTQPPELRVAEAGAMRVRIEKILEMLPSQLSFSENLAATMALDFSDKYEELGYAYIHEVYDRPPSVSDTKAELKNVQNSAESLLDALRRTHGPASETLYRGLAADRPTLGEIQQILKRLIAATQAPIPPSAKSAKGPDRREVARRVALLAACDYHRITGKEPTTTLPTKGAESEFGFCWLLHEIYVALRMAENSEVSNAREAVKTWKKESPSGRLSREYI